MADDLAPLAGETLMEYLVRTRPDYEWTDDDGASEPYAPYEIPGPWVGPALVRARLMSWEFNLLVASLYPVAPDVLVAPVWPGADLVTLGTPVAIDRGVTVTERMHGVLIAITAVDPKQLWYTYDTERAYRHIGALAFESDGGQTENWQALGFTAAVYCPRTMAEAAAVHVMTPEGTVGTITPWVQST